MVFNITSEPKVISADIDSQIVARLNGEGDCKVNHRGVHFGP